MVTRGVKKMNLQKIPDELINLARKNRELKAEISALQSDLSMANNHVSLLQDDVSSVQMKNEDLREEIYRLNTKNKLLKAEFDGFNSGKRIAYQYGYDEGYRKGFDRNKIMGGQS